MTVGQEDDRPRAAREIRARGLRCLMWRLREEWNYRCPVQCEGCRVRGATESRGCAVKAAKPCQRCQEGGHPSSPRLPIQSLSLPPPPPLRSATPQQPKNCKLAGKSPPLCEGAWPAGAYRYSKGHANHVYGIVKPHPMAEYRLMAKKQCGKKSPVLPHGNAARTEVHNTL
jgi:hypothetical protein